MTIFDGVFAQLVFSDHKCRELVGRILFGDQHKIKESSCEHKMFNPNGKTCWFDLYMKDEEGNLYNVEIQGYPSGAVPQRPRYHASLLNASLKVEDNKWKDLPKVKVAFICNKDYIGDGQKVYHIERTVKETGKRFQDEEEIIYINGEIEDETKTGRMIHDFNCKDPNKMYYRDFKRRVKEIKETKKGREEMCQALEKLMNEEREEGIIIGKEMGFKDGQEVGFSNGKKVGFNDGRSLGKSEGIAIGKEKKKKRMYNSNRYDIEDIAFATGMSEKEIKELCYS